MTKDGPKPPTVNDAAAARKDRFCARRRRAGRGTRGGLAGGSSVPGRAPPREQLAGARASLEIVREATAIAPKMSPPSLRRRTAAGRRGVAG